MHTAEVCVCVCVWGSKGEVTAGIPAGIQRRSEIEEPDVHAGRRRVNITAQARTSPHEGGGASSLPPN